MPEEHITALTRERTRLEQHVVEQAVAVGPPRLSRRGTLVEHGDAVGLELEPRHAMRAGDIEQRATVERDVFERNPRRDEVSGRLDTDEHRIPVQSLPRPVFEVERLERDRLCVEDLRDDPEDFGMEIQLPGGSGVGMQVRNAITRMTYTLEVSKRLL